MKTPPPIDITALRHDLDAVYHIPVHSLTFLPRGEVSWAYRVEGTVGQSYFLKLFRDDPLPAWAARLVYRLHAECGIRQVSYPLPTCSGDVISTLAGFPAAVFPYIDGRSLFELSARRDALYRLGQLLARLHACHQLGSACLRVERFDAWDMEKYHQVIAAAASPRSLSGPAHEAHRLLRTHVARLRTLLEDLLRFQQRARARPFTPCICHGDPTPGNILIDSDGDPNLIDWDDIILAPRERDLVFWEQDEVLFGNESSSPVLDGYRAIAGSFNLDPDIIGFYHRQWTVGEIADYGHRLLFEEHSEQQNRSDLENLIEEMKWLWNS